jgi:hypothetical protein
LVEAKANNVINAHFKQGLAFAEITTDKACGYKRRGVSTSDLASVLALHRVRRVVLNACRSAQYQDAGQSIALGILKAGVEDCIAMTHDVPSRAVEIFMSIFYDAILTKGPAFSFGAAAAWARQALRLKPARNSRYATSVSVYDYMIPVCYTNAFPQDSDAYNFTGRSFQFARRPPFNDVVGREADIFSLETRLLVSGKGLCSVGVLASEKQLFFVTSAPGGTRLAWPPAASISTTAALQVRRRVSRVSGVVPTTSFYRLQITRVRMQSLDTCGRIGASSCLTICQHHRSGPVSVSSPRS